MDYQNSKIYKIESITGEGEIYVGSTTKKYLSQRMQDHKYQYHQWKQGKVRKTMSYDIFDLYGIENVKITLLENVECQSKDELHAREGHYIKLLNCVNKCITGIGKKESSLKSNKKYNLKVGTTKCECGGSYLNKNSNKERHLKSPKHNDWFINQNNDEPIIKKQIICDCGGEYLNKNKTRHLQTIKHLDWIKNQQIELL
jgi:hypothetical protein